MLMFDQFRPIFDKNVEICPIFNLFAIKIGLKDRKWSKSIKNYEIHRKWSNLIGISIFLNHIRLKLKTFSQSKSYFSFKSGSKLIKFVVTSKNPASNLNTIRFDFDKNELQFPSRFNRLSLA